MAAGKEGKVGAAAQDQVAPHVGKGPFDNWPDTLYVIVGGFTACPAASGAQNFICDGTVGVFQRNGGHTLFNWSRNDPANATYEPNHGPCAFTSIDPVPQVGIHSEGCYCNYCGESMEWTGSDQTWYACSPIDTDCGTEMPASITVSGNQP